MVFKIAVLKKDKHVETCFTFPKLVVVMDLEEQTVEIRYQRHLLSGAGDCDHYDPLRSN